MDKVRKTVKEVFRDYNSNSFELNAAQIKEINLFKKKSELELKLEAEKNIKILDLLNFENYIEERFQISKVNIIIENKNIENIGDEYIKSDWNNILKYISHKHPMAQAFLKNSTIEIENNIINVYLINNGKYFLECNKFDVALSKILESIYGKKYKISYINSKSDSNIEDRRKKDDDLVLKIDRKSVV